MSKDKPFRFGVRLFLASFGFVALRFVLTPIRIKILTSLLSREQYGTVTLISVTVSFLSLLFSFGSLEYMLRVMPKRPLSERHGILRCVFSFFGLLSVLAAVTGAVVWSLLGNTRLHLPLSAVSAVGVLLVMTVHLSQRVFFLMAEGAYIRARTTQFLYADTWFVPVILLALFTTWNTAHALWTWCVWLVLSVVFTWNWVPLHDILRSKSSPGELKRILAFGVPIMPMILSEWVFRATGHYIVLWHTNIEEFAIYAFAVNVPVVGFLMGRVVLDILTTEFNRVRNAAHARTLEDLTREDSLREIFTLMLRYSAVIAIAFGAALIYLRRPVVQVLSGRAFLAASDILPWTAPAPLFFMCNLFFQRVLLALDQYRIVGAASLGAAAISVTLTLVLVPVWGAQGAAVASWTSMGFLSLFLFMRVRAWRWVIAKDLRLTSLVVLAIVCAFTFRIIDGLCIGAVLRLALAGLVCTGTVLGLRLMCGDDLAVLKKSMSQS